VAERFGDKFDSVSNLSLTALYELAAPSTPEEVRTEVAERVAAGESVTTAEVKEFKKKIKERDESLKKLRTQKTAADTENRVLTRGLKERDTKLRDLARQLDSLRGELQQTQQSANINYEPMKSALLSLWNVAPEEIKAWFLEFVMKGSESAGLGGSSPATVI
jgi:septal ring factor EnvC (AmiA/AmiB activator)